MEERLTTIGLMSGTSLDGVDLACCAFIRKSGVWSYEGLAYRCIPYPESWKAKLHRAFHQDLNTLKLLDKEYGEYLGTLILQFIQEFQLTPDLIASHGHTVFHKPQESFTLQIGDGQAIARATGIPVVNDFRFEDVSKGGQGAPLVPAGDKLLFAAYPVCLNIGGIANVSFDDSNGNRIAFDVCAANQVLDAIAGRMGYAYDENGAIARSGTISDDLLRQLNQLDFYRQDAPKSLGREWVEECIWPLLRESNLVPADLLRTFTEHIAIQIGKAVHGITSSSMLLTGGGAHNHFLADRIRANCHHRVVVPEKNLVDFKEALVFGFLGMLRWKDEINVYSSVTGASSDSCAGRIHLP